MINTKTNNFNHLIENNRLLMVLTKQHIKLRGL